MENEFDFGYGLVAAHRHKNPDGSIGGWVADTARVSGTAWVSGDAQVSGDARVYGGKYDQSPLYIQGSRNSITVLEDSTVIIGCQYHLIEDWVKNYKEIGKRAGYTDIQIKEYGQYLQMISLRFKKEKTNGTTKRKQETAVASSGEQRSTDTGPGAGTGPGAAAGTAPRPGPPGPACRAGPGSGCRSSRWTPCRTASGWCSSHPASAAR